MDSPGHSAQYCTYSFMDEGSKQIVSLQTLDKRETDRKSANMEKAGFVQALDDLAAKGIDVKEVVTDAHMGITAYLSMKLFIPFTCTVCKHHDYGDWFGYLINFINNNL